MSTEEALVAGFEWESLFSVGAMIGHLSYLFIIVAMLMDRLFYLRLLAIGSGLTGLLYSTIWLYDPVALGWETLFILAIVYQMTITAYHNRMSRFGPDESFFREAAIPGLSPSDARRLLRISRIEEAPAGTILAKEGAPVRHLVFILSGDVDIKSRQTSVAKCQRGDFVGEISVEQGTPATATAVTMTPVRYFAFEAGAYRRLVAKEREIAKEMELAFRTGLREKLMMTNQAVAVAAAS